MKNSEITPITMKKILTSVLLSAAVLWQGQVFAQVIEIRNDGNNVLQIFDGVNIAEDVTLDVEGNGDYRDNLRVGSEILLQPEDATQGNVKIKAIPIGVDPTFMIFEGANIDRSQVRAGDIVFRAGLNNDPNGFDGRLVVESPLQYNFGSLSAGMVLTSDAEGVASWTDPNSLSIGVPWATFDAGTNLVSIPSTVYMGNKSRVIVNDNDSPVGSPGNDLFAVGRDFANSSGTIPGSLSYMYFGLDGDQNTSYGKIGVFDNRGFGFQHLSLNPATGGVSIGTEDSPGNNALFVNGSVEANGSNAFVVNTPNATDKAFTLSNTATGNENFVVYGNGRVTIGPRVQSDVAGYTTNPSFNDNLTPRLSVDGSIFATRVRVTADTWADFVFDSNYKLLSPDSVQAYIDENGHLPYVPSVEEVLKQGIDLGTMDATLLRKIEELYLYMLKQEARIKELESELSSQK
jgi:hypothetical protein